LARIKLHDIRQTAKAAIAMCFVLIILIQPVALNVFAVPRNRESVPASNFRCIMGDRWRAEFTSFLFESLFNNHIKIKNPPLTFKK